MGTARPELSPAVGAGGRTWTAREWAFAALALGIVGSVVFGAISVFGTTTAETGDFQHQADYWFTGVAVPVAIAEIVLLLAVARVQSGRNGRLALVGMLTAVAALAVYSVQLSYSVAVGAEEQWGPTYVLVTVLAFVGHGLFAGGSWRTGVFPRWVLAIWPFVWVLGSMAASGATPLVLVVLYLVMASVLRTRGGVRA